jgi:hypothetical protein
MTKRALYTMDHILIFMERAHFAPFSKSDRFGAMEEEQIAKICDFAQ